MPITFAFVGPGRVGASLARRWALAGMECLGAVGRDAARTEDALAFVGAGRPLSPFELGESAAVVLLTVGDSALPGVVEDLVAARAVRPCSLWLHTSGLFGADVLAPVAAAAARVAALHPLVPIPDREQGCKALSGEAALVEGPAAARHLLRTLCRRAGLHPVEVTGPIDRAAYHAACALAANGTTGLLGLAARTMERALGVDADRASSLVAGLARAACQRVGLEGAANALSGPVLRGDTEAVRVHLDAIARTGGAVGEDAYRAVMRLVLSLARQRGLAADAAEEVERLLSAPLGGVHG
ncbi:MAG: DUF2520 domain-containing protein [Planctomycetota bacterium]|nr:DUF2520 domain-containing protein [Planctomycetota bacterium]